MASRRSSRAVIFALAGAVLQDTGIRALGATNPSAPGVGSQDADATLPPPAARPVDFETDVGSIFAKACLSGHGPKRQRSDYRLDVKESALSGGQLGGAIVPGHSERSALIRYVAGVDPQITMPAK